MCTCVVGFENVNAKSCIGLKFRQQEQIHRTDRAKTKARGKRVEERDAQGASRSVTRASRTKASLARMLFFRARDLVTPPFDAGKLVELI